jgi:short-subunit dehydrogenase
MTANTPKTFTLITGASGGFGAEFARLCARDGRNLILVARRGDKLADIARELSGEVAVHVITQDLAEHGAAQKVYKKIRRLRLPVDQLINNAGSGDYAPLTKANPTRQESMIAVNITALTLLTNLLLPDMIKRGHGRILNVSSVAGFVPLPKMSVYGASKAFVLSFSEALSAELRGTGVTVTCLCPSAAKTGFSRAARLSSIHPIAQSRISPKSIAVFGYRAMVAGLPMAIPGVKNKLFVQLATRLLPRAATRTLMVGYSSQA